MHGVLTAPFKRSGTTKPTDEIPGTDRNRSKSGAVWATKKGNLMAKPVKKLELTEFDSEDLLIISQIVAETLGDDADNWNGSWSINVDLFYD